MTDIVTAIDEATAAVCGWCQEPLRDDGPSLLYCDDRCQESWDRLQGEKLVDSEEPPRVEAADAWLLTRTCKRTLAVSS